MAENSETCGGGRKRRQEVTSLVLYIQHGRNSSIVIPLSCIVKGALDNCRFDDMYYLKASCCQLLSLNHLYERHLQFIMVATFANLSKCW